MKKIVLIFNHFEREHFGKDVFLFPYTLSKCVGGKAMIVYPETSSILIFLIRKSKEIDILYGYILRL